MRFLLILSIICFFRFAHALCGFGGGQQSCYKTTTDEVTYGVSNARFGEQLVEGADPKSFKELSGPPSSHLHPCVPNEPINDCPIYGKDKKSVYLRGVRLSTPGVDVKTFHLVSNDHEAYAVDKNNVYSYYNGKVLKGVDAKSFRWENGVWRDNKKIVGH